ncbi:hypothetical protein QP162_14095 [Sphingomonas aurantiaca]
MAQTHQRLERGLLRRIQAVVEAAGCRNPAGIVRCAACRHLRHPLELAGKAVVRHRPPQLFPAVRRRRRRKRLQERRERGALRRAQAQQQRHVVGLALSHLGEIDPRWPCAVHLRARGDRHCQQQCEHRYDLRCHVFPLFDDDAGLSRAARKRSSAG